MKCCEFTAGMFRVPIQIQREVDSKDSGGGRIKTWQTVVRALAYWKSASMAERLHAMQLNATVLHRVYIRYTPTPTAKHRILYQGEAHQIRGVYDVEKQHRVLEMLVEEGVPT